MEINSMKKKTFGISSLAVLGFGSSLLAAGEGSYVVRNGDTLSHISFKYIGKNIYKKNGSLERLLSFNPEIRNPDFIRPGQRIALGAQRKRELASAGPSPTSPPASDAAPAAPPPATEPSPASMAIPPNLFPRSRLAADLGFEYFRIDSTDKISGVSTTFLSKMGPETRFTWDLDWSAEWTSTLRLLYQSGEILPDTSSSPHAINNAHSSRYGFEAGGARRWSDSSRTNLFVGYKEGIFAHSPSPTQVNMDQVGSMYLKASHDLDLVSKGSARMGVGLAGSVLFPGTGPGYSTKTGYGGDLSTYLEHELTSVSLRGSVYYGLTKQDSDLVSQRESHLGVMFGVTWRPGK